MRGVARVHAPVHAPVFTLLESTRRPALMPSLSALLSIAAHGSVIAGAILISSMAADYTPQDHERAVKFLYPFLKRAPRAAVQEQVAYVGLTGAAGAAPVSVEPSAKKETVAEAEAVAVPETRPVEAATPEPQRAMSELEVDSTALRDPDSEGPVYPPTLLAKGIEGKALVRFVVSAEGQVDITTFRLIQSTDSLFTKAARDVLPRMKFRPAWFAGKPVSQLVEQEFTFRITRP